MNIKSITALLLCACLVLGMSACSGKSEAPAEETASAETADAAETPETAEETTETDDTAAVLEKVYHSYSPDDIFMSCNGTDYTWDIYFYLINYFTQRVKSAQNGVMPAWDQVIYEDETTAEFIKYAASDWLKYDAAVRKNAKELGVTLSEEDIKKIDDNFTATESSYGGAEEFRKNLEQNYCSEKIYKYLAETPYLADLCFIKLYGQNGSDLTDEQLAEFTANDGYMMAKHILLLTQKQNDEGETVEMSEEEKAAVREKMEGFKAELDACTPEAVGARFDELMNTYSEDVGGLQLCPDGYLFQSGDMVSEFEDGVLALEENTYGDIVETSYGYHLIYRLPIDYNAVPFSYVGSSDTDANYTVRYIVATTQFNAIVTSWENAVEMQFTEKYDELKIG